MKKFLSLSLALIMTLALAIPAFASTPTVDAVANITDDAATTAAETFLTKWFADKLSEHYTLYNFDFTFSTVKYENGLFDSFGYLEVDHHLRYNSLDELPYVQGMMAALNIGSMEAVVDGNFAELETAMSASTMSRESSAPLSAAQTHYLAAELKEEFSAVQEDMGDFNASYFFHITANFDGENLSHAVVMLEAEDVGYLPAEECLHDTATELYDDGVGTATEYVSMAMAYNEDVVANTPKPFTYANYDRLAARDYALQYAENPSQSCNCGTLSYKSSDTFPSGVTYSAWNNSEYPYLSDFCHNDCADFVSQAMSAGKLPEKGKWFRTKNVTTRSWGEAWTSVSSMKSYMTSNGYWTADKFSTCNAGNILLTSSGHVTMITLNNTVSHCYTGHTNDRKNVSFKNKSAYAYYAINLD